MQGYGDNFIPVFPEDEEDMLHTLDNPFCPIDPTCGCHEDPFLIAEVNGYVEDGLLTPSEATDFVNGKML